MQAAESIPLFKTLYHWESREEMTLLKTLIALNPIPIIDESLISLLNKIVILCQPFQIFVALIEGAGVSLQTIDVRAIFEKNGAKLALHITCYFTA